MAYDSDTRVKETLKDISRAANLKNLILRVFDESNDDQKLWNKGGLTFEDNEILYGSNDAGWFLKKPYIINNKKISDFTPVLLVEGSYGTETGNVGSAQYARFSHALGPAKEGFIGVYFIPFESTYIKKDGTCVKAYVRYDMLYAALNASNSEKGEYLFIDAYDTQLMGELLRALDGGSKIEINQVITKIKKKMKDFADEHTVAERRKYLYNDSRIGKLLMFNVVAFSAYNFRKKIKYKAGRFRNGHTIVGDALVTHYWHEKPTDFIFPRFTHQDCKDLDSFKKKEWLLLRQIKDLRIVTLEDLEFNDKTLEKELYEFIDVLPLLGKNLLKKEELSKRIFDGFKEGTIKINYRKVELNGYKKL